MLSDIVITDHACEILRSAKLTGFDVCPVDVGRIPERLDGRKFPRLWELVIEGRGGPAHKKSGIVKKDQCAECEFVEYSAFKHGIVVDPSTYDGSDFFSVAEYPRYVLVNEHAKSVIETHRMTNVAFLDSAKLK